jgi:hypothetical protein
VEYARNPDVAWEEVHNGVTVAAQDGSLYYLDEIGSALWLGLEVPASRQEILDAFAARFPEVAPERIAADLDRFLEESVAAEIVIARG